MPYAFLSALDPTVIRDDDETWGYAPEGVSLRRDYQGTDVVPTEAEITLREWRASGLDYLWAIEPQFRNLPDVDKMYRGVSQEYGASDCMISVDGGVTWLYWDSGAGAWMEGASWTTFYDLNSHLDSIPFAEFRLLFRVRLIRGTIQTDGPHFVGLRLGYALLPNTEGDDPHRTMRRWFESNVEVRKRDTYTLASDSQVLDLDTLLTIKEVLSAFNLTTDPTRSTNILTGVSDSTITFNAAQSQGDIIEVNWTGSVPVIIKNRDTDLFQKGSPHIPSLVLTVANGSEAEMVRLPASSSQLTKNYALRTFWTEQPPVPVDYRFVVHTLANSENLAIVLSNAAYSGLRNYSLKDFIYMVGTGAEAEIVNFTPPFEDQTNVNEGLSVKSFSAILCVREWQGDYETGVLANEFILLEGSLE